MSCGHSKEQESKNDELTKAQLCESEAACGVQAVNGAQQHIMVLPCAQLQDCAC